MNGLWLGLVVCARCWLVQRTAYGELTVCCTRCGFPYGYYITH